MFLGRVIAQAKDGGDTLTVRERGRERVFLCNDVVLSRLRLDTIYTGSYWDYFLPLPSLYSNPRILVIGLGGGTIPFQMESIYRNARIDVAELSGKVAELSASFLPKKLKARVMIGDGADIVRGSKVNTYDIIIVDPYRTYGLPEKFSSDEFIGNSLHALSDDGILTFNYILSPENVTAFQRRIPTLKQNFSMYLFGAPRFSGNRILICSRKLKGAEIAKRTSENFPDKKRGRHVLDEYFLMQPFPGMH
ncbi:MAG: fused MFS/spermidine synthase [Candidatus Marsarchaeota archaeon]|jgi:spermidine synthase|nr:fused MFS/spermidine synthase [Candidatus Marsarchaeota archaeon]